MKGSRPGVVFQESWENEDYRTVSRVEVRELDTQVGPMKYISKPNGATAQLHSTDKSFFEFTSSKLVMTPLKEQNLFTGVFQS